MSGGSSGSSSAGREEVVDPSAGAVAGAGAVERRHGEPGCAGSAVTSEVKTRLGSRKPAPPDAASPSLSRVTEPQAEDG